MLVTGASGFLGGHINGESSFANLLDYEHVHAEFSEEKPDIVLHLAALCGGIQFNKSHPADLISKNVQMALNVFDAAVVCGVKRVVTIGSTCAYPANLKPPFRTEDYHNGLPEVTNGAYGIAKRTICEIGEAYRKQHGISHLHIILANLYGPGDKSDHVIPDLIRKFRSGEVEVWGDGTQKREFLYVKDAAEIVQYLADSKEEGLINVGTGKTHTIRELVDLLSELTDYRGKITWNPSGPVGQTERLLDSEYRGYTDLRAGLKETLKTP